MIRHTIILIFIVVLSCNSLLCDYAYATNTWTFAVAGDVRDEDTTTTGVSAYLPAIATKIVSLSPQAVFVSGDLVNGDELSDSPDPANPRIPYATQFANFKSDLGMGAIYAAGIPIYPIRGNHENGGKTDKPTVPSLMQAYFNAMGSSVPQNGPNNGSSDNQVGYSWNLGLKNIRVVGVDDYFYYNSTQQGGSNYYKIDQAWLEKQLSKTAPTRYTFVMAHEPVYYLDKQGDFYGSTSLQGAADRKVFWDSLGTNGAKMYLCSHVHDVQVGTALDSNGNIIYQNMIGNGGAPLDLLSTPTDPALTMTYREDAKYGFALFTVTDANITITYYLYDHTAPVGSQWSTALYSITLLANPVNTWNVTSGNFSDGASWDVGAVPGATDTAVFDSGAGTSSTVNFTGNVTTNKLFVASGATTFNLNGHTYTVTTSTAIDGTEDATYQPSLTVAGNGSKLVAGALTMDAGATLSVGQGASVQCTTLTVDGNSTITGTGSTVATGAMTVDTGATFTVGAGTLVQCATLTVNANSTIAPQVSSAASYGQIKSTGLATVDVASAISMNVGEYIANGTQFKIIDAGGATVTVPGTISSSSYAVQFTANGTTDLILTAARVANAYANVSSNSNTDAVGAVLDQAAANGPTGDMLTVLNALDIIGSAAEVSNAIETMTPDMSSGTMQASQQAAGQFLGSVSNRLGYARNDMLGLATGDMIQGVGFWLQALGSNIHQGERNGVQGYNANLFGTSLGADKLIDDHYRVGLSGGYGFASVHAKTPGSPSDDINSFQGTIYGSYDSINLNKEPENQRGSKGGIRNRKENSWYVDGMFGFTENNYDSRREIWLANTKRVAKAGHYGQQYSTKLETGYTFVFEMTKALETTPFSSLEYSYLRLNKYKEDGANSLNLTVDGDGYNQMLQALGMKFAYPLVSKKAGTFIPAMKAAWIYDYFGDQFETTANFAGGGSSFTTKGAKPARNGMLLGAELAFLNKGNMTLTANYDLELKEAYTSNTYYATARFDF